MHMLDQSDISSICVTIAGVDASIRAPQSVRAVLNRTLAHACRTKAGGSLRAAIEVEGDDVVWRINGSSERSAKLLSATNTLPQVGGAVVSSLITDIAEAARLSVCRATVVERDGLAIAFTGDDWESGLVLATHLHTRGWRLLGGDYALIDSSTLRVLATKKLLYITLSVLDDLPVTYRRAVEASPWYSTPRDIAFYAVDPSLAHSMPPWAESAQLRAVLKVDGHISEFPSLEHADAFTLCEGLTSDGLERAGVAVAEIKVGDYISTCHLLQRWFDTLIAS
jgi:hypothetical protein